LIADDDVEKIVTQDYGFLHWAFILNFYKLNKEFLSPSQKYKIYKCSEKYRLTISSEPIEVSNVSPGDVYWDAHRVPDTQVVTR